MANNAVKVWGNSYWRRIGTALSPITTGDTCRIGNGTASAPAFSFTSNTDTGIYRDDTTFGADSCVVSCAGSALLAIGPLMPTPGKGNLAPMLRMQDDSGAELIYDFNRTDAHGDGVNLGSIRFSGNDDTGSAYRIYAAIQGHAVEDAAGAYEGQLNFKVAAGNGVEAVTKMALAHTELTLETGLDITAGTEDIDIDAGIIDVQANSANATFKTYSNTPGTNITTLIESEQTATSGNAITKILADQSGGGVFSQAYVYVEAISEGAAGTAALFLKASGTTQSGIFFEDGYHTGSGWSLAQLPFSNSTAEWTAYKTNFGEVSLLNAINQAASIDTLGELTDVDTSGAVQDEVLAYNASSGTWSPATIAIDLNWTDGGSFTFASASTFTVTDNTTNQAIYVEGRPIRFKAIAGTWKYGIVTGYSSGTVTFAGAELTAALDDYIEYDPQSKVHVETIVINGQYGDNITTSLIEDDLLAKLTWGYGNAYLVRVRHVHLSDDTTTNPDINVLVGGSTVLDTDDVTNTSWQEAPNTSINETNYLTNQDDIIELEIATAGVTGDAADLTVALTFVFA